MTRFPGWPEVEIEAEAVDEAWREFEDHSHFLTYNRMREGHYIFRGLPDETWRLTPKLQRGELVLRNLFRVFSSLNGACRRPDALILRDLMGHKSLRTTLQYAQVNGESVKKAFRTFDRQRRKT